MLAVEAMEASYGLEIPTERFELQCPDGQGTETTGPLPRVEIDQMEAAVLSAEVPSVDGSVQVRSSAGTIWLTGLPGAGKTTLAKALERQVKARGLLVTVLDGDDLRRGLSRDLGLSQADRAEQARRTAEVALLLSRAGVTSIVALVSPYESDRARAKEIHQKAAIPFVEVWVDTPVEICEQRDPKRLYSRARAGCLPGLTGVDAPYQPPGLEAMRVSGCEADPDVVARQLADALHIHQ